jgi:hypothetical protein
VFVVSTSGGAPDAQIVFNQGEVTGNIWVTELRR